MSTLSPLSSTNKQVFNQLFERHLSRNKEYKQILELEINETQLCIETGIIQDFMPQFFELSSDRFRDVFVGMKAEIDGHKLDETKHALVPTFTAFFENVYNDRRFDISSFSLLDSITILSFIECYCKQTKLEAIKLYFDDITKQLLQKVSVKRLAFDLLYNSPIIKSNHSDFELLPRSIEWLITEFDMSRVFHLQNGPNCPKGLFGLRLSTYSDFDTSSFNFFFYPLTRLDCLEKDYFAIPGFGDGSFEVLQKRVLPQYQYREFLGRLCGRGKQVSIKRSSDNIVAESPSKKKKN